MKKVLWTLWRSFPLWPSHSGYGWIFPEGTDDDDDDVYDDDDDDDDDDDVGDDDGQGR